MAPRDPRRPRKYRPARDPVVWVAVVLAALGIGVMVLRGMGRL
jgi:hypothetical protein